MHCNPLVGGPQTDLGELDRLHADGYNWPTGVSLRRSSSQNSFRASLRSLH